MARDPKLLFERYGRQLLVQDAEFAGQSRLHALAVVLAADRSSVAQAAAEAAGKYLVGAGVGRVVAPSAWAESLKALDPEVELLDGPGSAAPPVAHYYFAQRDYGFSVDIALTEGAAGWATGQAGPARVVTWRLDLGESAQLADTVAIGAAAADLLLADQLGLEALPAVVHCNWKNPLEPQLTKIARKTDVESPTDAREGRTLTLELQAQPPDLQAIIDDCQANYPNESCGLLLRTADGVLKTLVAKNLQDRYHALDPAEFPRTGRTAYKLNERLIAKAADAGETLEAIWHSHCDAGAYFSGEDVRCAAPGGQALYPGVAYLVVSVMGGTVKAMELYRFDEKTAAFYVELA